MTMTTNGKKRVSAFGDPENSAFGAPVRISDPPATLLVVDDDRALRELMAEILRLEGYSVLQADGAAQALRLAGEVAEIHLLITDFSMHLLITDFSMPEVDGLELTRRFRAAHPKTPVLMVSGSFPMLCLRSELYMDRFDFLAKPFHSHELLQKVGALLEAASPLPIRKQWHAG